MKSNKSFCDVMSYSPIRDLLSSQKFKIYTKCDGSVVLRRSINLILEESEALE